MAVDDPIFIVDLNELEDGNLLPVSMDYTLNLGARVSSTGLLRAPSLGDVVKIHSDDDDTLYLARVTTKINNRDYMVMIDWNSCAPVLNGLEWSARDMGIVVGSNTEMTSPRASAFPVG